ncbi:putative DNA helicase [Lupinus albus]|uniref:Regulator of telomere elongation helicase 1 homolog n=1 Tax=Lupinus albus TaxID=3870 RepID=A0A6A4NGW0_LUPAL|nr:putative DNA helicase [Lupinus albus]
MPTYNIRGIDVDFPYEAYDSQIVYMDKVMQSLQEKCNALLESPTGTGKTLCLLCATLAWRKSLGSFTTGVSMKTGDKSDDITDVSLSQSQAPSHSTIVYTSRTHSQIRQVIQELKRTSYRPKMIVLGSREQLCIHDQVKQLHGKTQSNACRMLCRRRGKRQCKHFSDVSGYLKSNPHLGEEPIDIEDLVNIGTRFGPCPYYLSKELHKVVDIVFAPYNYLIDRGYRKSLQLSWSNSVLIFDEAHNLESICADAASFDLPSWLLTACISEAQTCIGLSIERREKSNDKSQNPEDFALLKALLLKLEKRISEMPIVSKELGCTKPGPYIYELLNDLKITDKTASKLKDTIAQASTLLEEHNQQKSTGTICRLDSFSEILDTVFRDGRTGHGKYYRAHVQEVEGWAANGSKGKVVSRTLSWWCFNPGIAMEEFPKLGVRSVILTSGTLSPMESFAEELKLNFPIRLENPHVITPSQIWAGVVTVGPSGRTFNSSYRSRDSLEYKQELGNAIVNLARIVPDGLLVFFPSYYLLDQCIGCWKSLSNESATSIWERICKHKKPVIEPRESSLFALSIKDYISKLNDTSASGAVFFAVCRGKVSEGLDFADHAGRAVLITGLPFATITDAKVRLKREYLDQQPHAQGETSKVLTGDEWYNQQASRAVNQAVGRVIRHRHDYGAIIFCDERFAQPHRQSQVSRWIQPHIKCFSRFGEVVFTLTRFFRDGRTQGPTKLSLLEAKKEEILGETTSSEHHLEKIYRDKLFSPRTTPVASNCSFKASSSLDTKKCHTSFLGEVVPANRSSLASDNCKIVGCESSRDTCHTVLHGRKIVLSEERDMVDLVDSCQPSEKSKDVLIAPCSAKKRRFISGEYDLKQHFGNSHEHSSGGEQQRKDDITSQSISPEFGRQKRNLPADSAAPTVDKTEGSAFLAQVREKLSAAEYIDFVGYMKALKTKAMKIGDILQCICRLFSGPERLPLLKRFKDYIPAKYHSLYEQYADEKN